MRNITSLKYFPYLENATFLKATSQQTVLYSADTSTLQRRKLDDKVDHIKKLGSLKAF